MASVQTGAGPLWLGRLAFGLPRSIRSALVVSVLLGIAGFSLECLFVVCFQLFLGSIGLIDPAQVRLARYIDVRYGLPLFLLYGLGRAVLSYHRSAQNGRTYQRYVKLCRERLFDHLYRRAFNTDANTMVELFNEKVVKSSYAIKHLGMLLQNSAVLLLLLAASAVIAPREFLICWSLTALIPFLIRFLNRRIAEEGERITIEYRGATKLFTESIRNHFLISIYNLFDAQSREAGRFTQRYYEAYERFYRVSSLKTALLLFLGINILVGTTWVSVSHFGTPGEHLIAFLYFYIQSIQSLSHISDSVSGIRLNLPNMAALDRVVPDRPAGPAERTAPTETVREVRRIECRDVSFAYPGGRRVICGVSLIASAGDVLVIRGQSGSGKSTLVSLLVGLLRPTSGQVLWNGRDADRMELDAPQAIGYVSSEPFLVPSTLRVNLFYPSPPDGSVSDARIIAEFERVGLASFLADLPSGLDTKLDEKMQLSSGQKQRLAAVRVLLRDPRIVILDEATSNLDRVNERRIIDAFLSSHESRITIIISHRDLHLEVPTVVVELGDHGSTGNDAPV